MTLFRRILLYYVLTLSGSLAVVGFCSWVEFGNQLERIREGGVEAIAIHNGPLEEAMEIVLYAGLPAILIGVISGMVVLRRALRPIQALTAVLEQTDVTNLAEPVPGSGNGDELDRMTAVFNRMKHRLGRSFTQASEFTLHASHELKTPLTIMHGTLEQMLTEAGPGTRDGERVASLLEEVQRLSTIVGQLTFLATADAGLLDPANEAVALHELVSDLADEAAILASGGGIAVTLTACEPVMIRGNRMRLRQLLLNLADNAVKYNQAGGKVEISLTTRRNEAVFHISNTGPTLRPMLVERVFERFFRGDAAHGRAVEGSGLGLSIAKSIVEAHHGEIRYEVPPAGRTQVTVTLPVEPARAER
ncbi:MAG: ATP-binding protein [Verrucomicrobia bacterium]|nr:ATP-binding protein [Verrucomicrobiota bacterium]